MKKLWSKRWFRFCSIFLIFIFGLFIFRNNILRGVGNWLVSEDPLQETQAAFILGGNSFERGMEAVRMAKELPQQKFVCTGGNYPLQIRALDTLMFEAELTRHLMAKNGVARERIEILTNSRSTMDESFEILKYCQDHSINKITVVSSSFHLRRVRWVFEDKFEEAGITVLFHGSDPDEYNSENWWKNEEGLIMANNELVKLLYYAIKY
jgi:uncharacterized SAM-binding protein YcdF (DUF218 family)